MPKNNEEFDWSVTAVTALEVGCTCRKEFQVRASSLRAAALKAQRKIKKDMGGAWRVRAIWWLDPGREQAV